MFCRTASLAAALLLARLASGQVMEGEVRVAVRDPEGRPVAARVEASSRSPEFRAEATADDAGVAVMRRLPLGAYTVIARRDGFSDGVARVELRSALPVAVEVELRVAPVETTVTVAASAPPLLDVEQPAVVQFAGRDRLDDTLGTTLGRSVIDVVTTMPGWLLEANAVLHPRGSEYDTQYVVDGMPLYDNRSLAFAPAFETGEFEAVNVLTGGLPAEYGRRLGGVIALDTRRVSRPGGATSVDLLRGGYGTAMASFGRQQAWERTALSFGALGGVTDRYLDPPSLENFTNRGSSGGFHTRLSQELTERDRLTVYLRSNRTSFLVPNDLAQQAAGQRQDRRTAETAGQIHYQRVFSSRAIGSARGLVRDLSSRLWSNPLATPVHVDQDRGFREGALQGDIAVESERHTFKFGGDVRLNAVRERFRMAEADEWPELAVDFGERRRSNEIGLFVQDRIRLGRFAATLGLRFDRYRFLIRDRALSPRVALSYYIPRADLLLRASYDRVFQPPPMENLLLSSLAPGLDLDDIEDALPVPASRGNFYEVGLRKPLGGALRLDVSHYWRIFGNFIDDDVFLNTGVSFPITFESARVQGTEARLELPRWRRLSGFVSYANMLGVANAPVTGGLFVEGGEAEELREPGTRFPISQDQRNTVAAQIRVEAHPRLWFLGGVRYGSGLPVELDDDDDDDDDGDGQPISQAILDKVNFERGRARPNASLDFSIGARVWEREERSIAAHVDLRNATGRLNVINFSGVFSGTALAPGRQASLRLRFRF